ncbi:NAD(P)/FAD-dependent oxidoreductase [Paenibacillus campinasensis]|uniref:NAD(P)/FAD-dependent oxidoreductase n=1 Tax=Paenibacillus campinasensis TaxID=66347 RepID=A0ABW9T4Q2_9BACL|nr:nitrite reductase large subunit NirB [Paenibacillus campinasensis]MUG67662.1 NAD(P)/FAD-dependent oxidoreductase [Paenibacillus campinasensis]
MNKRKKLIVVGNGMAGVRCIEEIVKLAPERYEIIVFGAEPRPNYNRILLSKVLEGQHAFQDIVLNDWSWYDQHGIRLHAGETVSFIHTQSRYIETVSGMKESYDALIVASGSTPFIPPISGTDKAGVLTFRTVDDCVKMKELSNTSSKAAVIGGGLLGLEAARGLLNLNLEVDVIHNAPYIMNRQLDAMSARMLQKQLEEQGMRFHLSRETTRITGRAKVKGLRFSDGATLDADMVVMAVGIRPNIELAMRSGIHTRRAIVVDDYMRTNVPDVYAVGECAEHRGISYGLVAPLYEQGKVLARVLCGMDTPPYTGSIPYSQLKVSGVDVFSVGEIGGENIDTAMQSYNMIEGTYKKVTMRHGIVAGAILFGDPSEGPSLLGLVKRAAPVSELIREEAGGMTAAEAAADALPEHETVCSCNGVSKGIIMQAILSDGLETVAEVKASTKASGSCGGCAPAVAALVKLAKAGGQRSQKSRPNTADRTPARAVCSCTDMSHAALRQAIDEAMLQAPASISGLMEALGFVNRAGCGICRPAVRYYAELAAADSVGNPGNVQSVGASDSAPEDRSYRGVHIRTGDHAERTDADVERGMRWIEEQLMRDWANLSLPYPVTAGIAESTHGDVSVLVQGIGIAASPAGWEVYLGGHAQHPVREAQLVGLAEEAGEAVRLASACLQWYRQKSRFGEPLWQWVDREGIVPIREHVLDACLQQELADKLIGNSKWYDANLASGHRYEAKVLG